ncbi:MAG TPA: hypothetical protein VGI35_10000 [Steroidobacteraceae bacterium]
MTPFTSARLPGKSAAALITLCLATASATGLALAGFPAAAAAAEQADAADAAGGGASAAELDWARDALARNGALEVVSSDRAARTITVRVKSTGELRRVRADDVIAAPPPDLGSRTSRQAVGLDSTSGGGSGGRVIASGPGYSITAAGPATGAAQPESTSDAGAARNLPVEHRHEPIICQGAQLRQIDNRNLVFDGDAVSVEQGCELHITNSSITAHGVGIAARGASVHVDNSIIDGSGGAVDASDGAQVYAHSSVFKGLIRRNDTAAFHDLGGNVGN